MRHWILRWLPWSAGFKLHSVGRRWIHFLWELGLWPRVKRLPHLGSLKLWHLEFPNRVFPSAGVFKTGRGLGVARRMGAGAHLVGTTTFHPRAGNLRSRLFQPFASLTRAQSAVNALGLPNPGHAVVAARVAQHRRVWSGPLGASLARDPEMDLDAAFAALDQGFKLYTSAGVDFFELNESCPNTPEENLEFSKIMEQSSHLLRDLVPPVLLKLSVDMDPKFLAQTLDLAVNSGFRGAVLGNTSVGEGLGLDSWSLRALRAFRLCAGGGLSGRAIAPQSRELLKLAQAWRLKNGIDRNRFALVSCGGIITEEDLRDRLELGADLCQMYTGLFV